MTRRAVVIDTVATTDEVWREARKLATQCRRRRLTIPATDLLIAACARAHDLGLLHRDAHFEKLEQALGTPS